MVHFEVSSDGDGVEFNVDWGAVLSVRVSEPSFVFVTAPGLKGATAGGSAMPLMHLADGATAAARLDGGSVIGPIRVEATGVGRRPARLDVLLPSAERALDEFLRSIRLVEISLRRLRGGLVYLDSTGMPRRAVDPYRVAVFVRDHVRSVVELCWDINENPWRSETFRHPVRPPGAAVDLEATRRLLIRRPELLAPAPIGIIDVAHAPMAPSLVVSRTRTATIDVPENRRIARFIGRLWYEAESVARAGVLTGDDLADLRSAQFELASLMEGTLFGELAADEGEDLALEASSIEREDARYAALQRLRVLYLTEVVETADREQLERQITARPDEVFQGLCTLLLAAAFGLEKSSAPKSRGLWESPEWLMYADRTGGIPSWRSATARPDDYRPDFVLVRRRNPSRCVLLDAKASCDAWGHVPGERLKEVQAYLNAFGVHRAGVLYPGPMERAATVDCEDISAHGYLLRELPLRPVEPGELPTVLDNLRARVIELEDESSFVEAL